MKCPKCNGATAWRGTLARGRLACDSCDPDMDGRVWVSFEGWVSPTLARYYREVSGFHRDWCMARLRSGGIGGGSRLDPSICDCGHAQMTPFSREQIERKEIVTYGAAVIV